MMGTWTNVLYRPLVCKQYKKDVFTCKFGTLSHQDIHRDGMSISINTHDASHLPVKKV
jgi:hypothetical protein